MGFFTEKEKAELEHKFKIRQIILDKALWTVVVVLLVFVANMVLEGYRGGLTKERFFLEKKYDAVLSIQDALGDLFETFQRFTVIDKGHGLPGDYKEQYRDSLYNFNKVFNKSLILLSEDSRKSAQYFIMVFSGFNIKDVAKCRDYREFSSDVGGWLIDNLLVDLGLESTWQQSNYRFKGIEPEIAHTIDQKTGANRFLDNEFEKWKKWRKNHGIK